MLIAIDTNHPDFLNDLSEEARLFFDAVQTGESSTLSEYDMLIRAHLLEETEFWFATAHIFDKCGNTLFKYEYKQPAVFGSELILKRYRKRFLKIAVFRALKTLFPQTPTPWGSLTGIRPTRLLRELENSVGEEAARRTMLNEFDVSYEKYALAHAINTAQRPFINDAASRDVDVYIGIPYCKTRCLYCSFLSDVRTKNTDMRAYIDALKRDISHGAALLNSNGYRVKHMYMGGGTPTVLTVKELCELISHCLNEYKLQNSVSELTVEAGRPDTIDHEKLTLLRDLGISRISINPQTMNAHTLEVIGRRHTTTDVMRCFKMASDMGFLINMDIITCLPGESVDDVSHTLKSVLELKPHNLTVHTLALKRSSLLKRTLNEYPLPDADTAVSMLAAAHEAAIKAGLRPYYMYRQKYMRGNLENIGYSVPNFECAYNIDMMEETVSIMAHGAGAMTKRVYTGSEDIRVERIPNPKDVPTYISKLERLFKDKQSLFCS